MDAEILALLLKQIKDSDTIREMNLAVQNYKMFCEAELTRSGVARNQRDGLRYGVGPAV